MGDLDETLQQLALRSQQQSGTGQRRTLMQLWETIYRSGKLYRPPRDRLPPGYYQDIYDEAIFRLMEYVFRRIDRYDPTRGTVMTWVNMKLDRSFIPDAIDDWRKEESHLQRPTLEDLDADPLENLPNPTQAPLPSQRIKECLEEDEGDCFKNECMKERPSINFQQVALLHHVEGYSFKSISDQLQVSYTTLISFYQRRLKAFAPQIRQACQY